MAAKFEVINDNPARAGGSYVGRDRQGSGFGTLWADAIDTGLAIILYDPKRQFGTIAHITGGSSSNCIVGNLFSDLEEGDCPDLEAALVGAIDISAIVKDHLSRFQIPIIGEDLGPVPIGREVHLHCNDKNVQVYRYTPSYNR